MTNPTPTKAQPKRELPPANATLSDEPNDHSYDESLLAPESTYFDEDPFWEDDGFDVDDWY